MKKIQAGLQASKVRFDFREEGFLAPMLWETKGNKDRKITINFVSQGHTEEELRSLGWCGVDGHFTKYVDGEDFTTARFFRKHTIREVLAGDNQDVLPQSIGVDDCCSLIVDLKIKRGLRVRSRLYLDLDLVNLMFDVVVWSGERPVEKYAIECPGDGDIIITEYQNNGKSMAAWPIGETLVVQMPDVGN